jgi:hypothetical protein
MKEEDIPADRKVVREKRHVDAANKAQAKANLVKSLKGVFGIFC